MSWGYLRFITRRMGFGNIWIRWFEALIFSSSMSMLVNESLTSDFKVERGLRQGDPLSPFLFLMVIEGLARLFQNATSLREFLCFKFNEDLYFELLPFAYNIVIICDGSLDNV